jgi:hypothetical protein
MSLVDASAAAGIDWRMRRAPRLACQAEDLDDLGNRFFQASGFRKQASQFFFGYSDISVGKLQRPAKTGGFGSFR